MRFLIAIILLCVPSLAGAQVSQVLPQLSIDKSGSEKRLSVYDPDKPGSDKLQSLFKKRDGTFKVLPEAIPPEVPLNNAPLPATNLLAPDGINFGNPSNPTVASAVAFSGRRDVGVSVGTHPFQKRLVSSVEVVAEGSGTLYNPENFADSPASADYTLGTYISKKDWDKLDPLRPASENKSRSAPGEIDGQDCMVRQSNGDAACRLVNVFGRNGFFAGEEGLVGDLNSTNHSDHVVSYSYGVINPRDNAYFGYVAGAHTGMLDVAFRAQDNGPGRGWVKSFQSSRNGQVNFEVDGATGGILSSGNIGTGYNVAGDLAIQIGQQRAGSGSSRLDLTTTNAGIPNARLLREAGTNGVFNIQQTGTGVLQLVSANGDVSLAARGATRLFANDTGVTAFGNFSVNDGSGNYPTGSIETVPGAGKMFVPATGADLPTVERFGITGDGSTADSARFQAALSAEGGTRTLFFKAKTYTFSGCYTSRGYIGLRGLGAGDETSNPGAGPKIIFTGNCPATGYISNANPAVPFYHAFFSGLTLIGAGTTPWMFDFRSCVACSFTDMTVYMTQNNGGFLRSRKINPSDVSWNNRIMNVRVQVPDAALGNIVNEDWSDSEVISSHFTGGKGYMSRGYGAKYIGNQFERSSRCGFTISKETPERNAIVMGNHFDGNAICGMEIDVTRDTSTNYFVNAAIAGNIYRTVDPNTGAPGQADIIYSNPSANTYTSLDPVGEAHLVPGVLRYKRNTGSWIITGQPAQLSTIPVYADNNAAFTGGLDVGEQYRTPTGVLMVRF